MNWIALTEAGGGAPTPSARGLEVECNHGGRHDGSVAMAFAGARADAKRSIPSCQLADTRRVARTLTRGSAT